MKKFQRFCTLFLLMIGLCSFALHVSPMQVLWRQVEQAQKEEFAANGSEADGENLPESRVGEKMLRKCSRHISVGRPIRKD